MVGNINLSQDALNLIKSHSPDGESMIATCRAIFSGTYDDEIYQSDLFDVFQLICDDSDNFVLDRFGIFNSIHKPSDAVDGKKHQDEINDIYKSYNMWFEQSLNEFKKKFDI
jgi:hypothetical protein